MVPKQMNFRESIKRPLTPTPCPLEWPLSLEIMCMYFILSGPHTYIYATICGAINFWRLCIQFKKLLHNFPKWWGAVKGSLDFFLKIYPFWYPDLGGGSLVDSRAQWECQNENFETGHLFSIVKLNFNVGLFSCIFWFEAIFLCKSAIFCRSLFTREKGPK